MKNTRKQLLCLLLASTVVLATGCNTGDNGKLPPQEVKAGMPDYSTAEGVIELDCWLGPKLSEEQYKLYADCGYNWVHYNNTSIMESSSLADVEGHFALAEKYGLKVMLAMNAFNVNQNTAVPLEYYDKQLGWGKIFDKYAEKGTLAGYMPADEPSFMFGLQEGDPAKGSRAYEDIADYLRDEYLYFNNRFPNGKFELVHLHAPKIGGTSLMIGEGKKFTDYAHYLNHYYENVLQYVSYDQRVFSMDDYPYVLGREGDIYVRDCTINSLETMGYLAEEYGAEKWTYLMNHENVFNTQSVLYQYYTFMVYGYTHFVTYCYTHEYGTLHSIDANGRPTDNYYYYQAAHDEIKSFENVYRQFTDNWLGCLAYVGSETITNDSRRPWKAASKLLDGYHRIDGVKATQDLMIGVMKDKDGYEGFLLSNQMNPTGNTANLRNNVEVTFNQAEKAIVYQDGQEPVVIDLVNGKLSLVMKSGGGAFVIPVKGA